MTASSQSTTSNQESLDLALLRGCSSPADVRRCIVLTAKFQQAAEILLR